MTTLLLIGHGGDHGVIAEQATLEEAFAAIARYRDQPETLPRASDAERAWIGEVADQIEFDGREAVHVDRETGPWFYVLRGGAAGFDSKPRA